MIFEGSQQIGFDKYVDNICKCIDFGGGIVKSSRNKLSLHENVKDHRRNKHFIIDRLKQTYRKLSSFLIFLAFRHPSII